MAKKLTTARQDKAAAADANKPRPVLPVDPPTPPRRIPFSVETFERVCVLIGEGYSLRGIAKAFDDLPTPGMFMFWVRDHPELQERYVSARDTQQHVYADDQVHIADTDEDAARARNRMDARRWHAGKLLPKVYGDRTQMDIAASVKHELPTVADVEAAKKAIMDKL